MFYKISVFLIFLMWIMCGIDIDYEESVEEMVKGEGYPLETHNVTTEDGYILTFHRIPHGHKTKNSTHGKVVLLVHAFLCSSAFWILLPGKSLGYVLADEGYDVWMINTRGNRYSRRHINLNPDQHEAFWDYSWHEIGFYDLPASIDYMLEVTNVSSVYYCGHSQGTTALYVMASLRPQYNSKIKVQVSLGPTAFWGEAKSPVVRIPSFVGSTRLLTRLLLLDNNLGELLSPKSWPSILSKWVCRGTVMEIICEAAFFSVMGYNNFEISPSDIPVIFGQFPAGAATKQWAHYVQLAGSGRFSQYDYGTNRNMERYDRPTPPDYNLSKITIPGYSIHGSHDWINDVRDVEKCHLLLGNPKDRYLISDPPYSHMDYVCAESASKIVNPKILEYFEDNSET